MSLNQLSKTELVQVIISQQKIIEELKQEIGKLKVSRDLDSQTSSKPPSTDLLKKSEKESTETEEKQKSKRKPGGQPGHPGKTRKGFDRIDRYVLLRPEKCSLCQSEIFEEEPVKVETQQVAQLVERPIEIVEYHRDSLPMYKVWSGYSCFLGLWNDSRSRSGSEATSIFRMARQLWTSSLRKAARDAMGIREN